MPARLVVSSVTTYNRSWSHKHKYSCYLPLLFVVLLLAHGYPSENITGTGKAGHRVTAFSGTTLCHYSLECVLKHLPFQGDSTSLSCKLEAGLQRKCCIRCKNLQRVNAARDFVGCVSARPVSPSGVSVRSVPAFASVFWTPAPSLRE